MADLVLECHAFLRPELERAGLASKVEVSPDLPKVDIDEGQLRQALLNLIRNAREALPKGGQVVMRVQCDDGQVAICIDDDGPGIPDEVRSTIFDPIYTTKQHGTGLGLAIVKQTVEMHGGRIRVESKESEGSTFTVDLPAS